MTASIRLSAILLLVAGLTACAGAPRGERLTYQQELDRLEADCTARQGILVPTRGSHDNRPATDYACQISGGGSRLPN